MRVLTVTPYYFPAIAYGGVVPLTHGISRELVRRGHEVVVYTTDAMSSTGRQPLTGEHLLDGVQVHYFPNVSNALAYHWRAFLPPALVPQARREVSRFDVVHLHDFYTLPNVWISHLARSHGVPLVISPHGSYPPIRLRGRVLVKQVFLALFGNGMLARAARVAVISAAEGSHYVAAGHAPERVVNVKSGVDDSEFAPLPPRGSYRPRLGIPADVPVILFFGRVDPVKGLDLLLPAVRDLTGTPAAHVIIAGPDFGARGPLEALARRLSLADRVHFLPLITGAVARRELFADADLFCLPSRSEGFPVSVLELMAAGLPGVVSTECNFPELTRAGAGLVVPPDQAALTAALQELTASPARREQVGRAARRLIETEFRVAQVVDRLEVVYRELASARGGGAAAT